MVAVLEFEPQRKKSKDGWEEEEEWSDFLSSEEEEGKEKKKVGFQETDANIDIPEDPYQVRTQRTFTNNPYNKGLTSLLLVGTGVFVLMQFLRFVTGGYASLFEPTETANVAQEVEESSSSILRRSQLQLMKIWKFIRPSTNKAMKSKKLRRLLEWPKSSIVLNQ